MLINLRKRIVSVLCVRKAVPRKKAEFYEIISQTVVVVVVMVVGGGGVNRI